MVYNILCDINKNIPKLLGVFLFFFFCQGAIAQTYEKSYTIAPPDGIVNIGSSKLFHVPVNGIPDNAIITNVAAKFDYIAYGQVQNYVSCRLNKGTDPGSFGGVLLVSQGNLPEGNPGTYGYVSFTNWNGQSPNANYYFRFFLASGHQYTTTINKIYVKVTYTIPILTVTYPNGGETLTKGQNYTITWNSQNVTGNIQIDLYKGGTAKNNFYLQLAAHAYNTGKYPFSPPSSLPDGTDYKIGISSMKGTVYDFSNNYFTIKILPDLAITKTYMQSISWPGQELTNPKVGDKVQFCCDFQCVNANVTGSFYVNCYLDGNPNPYFSEQFYGATAGSTYHLNTPGDWIVQPGSHTVEWKVDAQNQIKESSETNNDSSRTWDIPLQFDLKATAASIVDVNGKDVPGLIGQYVYPHLNYSVIGQGTTPAFDIKCLVDDTLFFTKKGVSNNGNSNYSITATSGFTVKPGSHSISWTLDYNNNIPESNEKNNIATMGWTAQNIPAIPTNVKVLYQKTQNSNLITYSPAKYALGYKIYWNTTPGVTKQNSKPYFETNKTSFEHTGVQLNTCYYYKVAAYNNSAESDLSLEVHACPNETLDSALYSPTQDDTITSSDIKFKWAAIPHVIKYELYVDNNQGLGSCEVSQKNITALKNLTDTTYKLGGNWLPQNKYYWQVWAIRANDTIKSNPASFIYLPTKSNCPVWTTIYRAYSKTDVDHLYTINLDEVNNAIAHGFVRERDEGYISKRPFNTMKPDTLVYVYRLYFNPNDGYPKTKRHYYITDGSRRDSLIRSGYIYEGILGYTYQKYRPGLTPMRHFYLNVTGSNPQVDDKVDNFYTISNFEMYNALKHHYTYIDSFYVAMRGEDYNQPFMETQPIIGAGINPISGSLGWFKKDIFSLPTGEISLNFNIYYQSLATFSTHTPLGNGWSDNYSIYLDEDFCSIYVFWPGGIINKYPIPSGYNSPVRSTSPGVYDQLIKVSDTQYKIITKNQVTYTLEKPGAGQTYAILKSISDRNHNSIVCSYRNDTLSSVSAPGIKNRTLFFNYYPNGMLESVTDPIGRKTVFTYDDNLNLITFKNPRGYDTEFKYKHDTILSDTLAGLHLLTKIIMPNKDSITNDYGSTSINRGKIISQNTSSNNKFFTINRSPHNVIVSNGLGNKINFVTNQTQTILRKVQLLPNYNDLAIFKYADANNPTKPTQVTDGNGNISYRSYDLNGNLKTVRLPLGVTYSMTYTNTNDLKSYTDPNSHTTTFGYTHGNLSSVTNSRGTTTITRNSDGTIGSITDPMGITSSMVYNSYKNIKSINDALGHKSTNAYDLVGRLTSFTDALQHKTSYGYNNDDLIESVTNANQMVTRYQYDPNDNLDVVTNALNRKTKMGYNHFDLLDSLTNPLGESYTYTYFGNGLPKTRTSPDGQIISYIYDSRNRITSIVGPDFNNAITYDNNDNITGMLNKNGKITLTYDALNRLKSQTDYFGNTVSYEYDNTGNKTAIIYPGNKIVKYHYYDDNLIKYVVDWNNDTTFFTYLSNGLPDKITYPNKVRCIYKYDAAGRRIEMMNLKSNGDTINYYHYFLNAIGMPDSSLQKEPLTFVSLPSENINYTYNAANRIKAANQTSFSFDKRGNMTNIAGNGKTAFGFNSKNQLISVNGKNNFTFQYDGFGYRRSATRNGKNTRYVLDISGSSENAIMETNTSNQPQFYYVYANGALLYRIKASDYSISCYHFDPRGNVIALTDKDQNITHSYLYGPFGRIFKMKEKDFNPFRFVGQYGVMYEGSSLYFMRARYYNPKIGRFLSEDPVWNLNLYSYGGNNPIINIDANGDQIITIEALNEQLGIEAGKKLAEKLGKTFVAQNSTKLLGRSILKSTPIAEFTLEIANSGYSFIKDPSLDNLSYVTMDITATAVGMIVDMFSFGYGGTIGMMYYSSNKKNIHHWIENSWLVRNTGDLLYNVFWAKPVYSF